LKLIRTISKTPLFKVTSLNSVSVLLKIGTGLITSKVLAIFVGPGGMALVGNLRNFLSSAETVSTLGFQNGIVKYVVDHKDDEERLRKIISTVFISLLTATLLLSVILFVCASYFSQLIFDANDQLAVIFKVLALLLPWYATTVFLLALINGLGKFRNVIYINIFGNVLGLLFSVFMIWKFQTFGALLSIIVPPSLLFFVAFYYVNQEIRFLRQVSFAAFEWKIIRDLSEYSLMTLLATFVGPLVYLAIRNNAIANIGIAQAGYWEAMNRISTYYLMFVSSILSLYFFPKLTLAKSNQSTREVFRSYYKGIFPLFAIALVVVYFLRFVVVALLFTPAFLPTTKLFFWQLLGDVFKAASLILGYQFFAKKLTAAFVLTELFSLAMLYGFSRYFMSLFGIEGIVMAHALTYFVYLLVLIVYFRKSFF